MAHDHSNSEAQTFYVIWDFDWSLINENSDYWPFRSELHNNEEMLNGKNFSKAFNEYGSKYDSKYKGDRYCLINFMNDIGWPSLFENENSKLRMSKEEFIEKLCKIPVFKENIEIVNKLYNFSKNNKENITIKQFIVSDANTVLIDIILDHLKLSDKFEKILTNPGEWVKVSSNNNKMKDSTPMSVASAASSATDLNNNSNSSMSSCMSDETKSSELYDSDNESENDNNINRIETIRCEGYFNEDNAPRDCIHLSLNICKPTICKGKMVDSIAFGSNNNNNVDRVVYIGDGAADYCACTHLRKNKDFAFVRKGKELEKIINNKDKKYKNAKDINANVKYWNNGKELLQCFRQVFKPVFK